MAAKPQEKTADIQLTTRDLKVGFGVGHMAIYNYRKGTPTKKPLPFKKDDKGHVTFPSSKVIAWAEKHGVAFKLPKNPGSREKPGPVAPVPKKQAAKLPDASSALNQVAASLVPQVPGAA